MSRVALVLIFVAWAVANLVAYGVRLFSIRVRWVHGAETFCKISQWLLAAVVFAVIAEGWWQEGPLHFSSTPTSVLTVPIQDHGQKYVSPHDAEIIGFFHKVFYLVALPFIATFLGKMGLERHARR